jgi:Domain of unknown function (DUF3846)
MSSSTHSDAIKAKPTRAKLIALVIPVEGPMEEIELDGSLKQLQTLVGGYIQALPLPAFADPDERATAYVHEEGKLIGLEPNMRATDFMVPGCGLFFCDYIAGPFVLCGFDPRTGNHRELPEPVIRRARLIESEAS